MARKPKPAERTGLPSKHEVLEFIKGAQGRPAGKREIARAFSVKGGDRIALKRLLAEMTEEGLLSGNRKRFKEPGILPPVAVIEVVARDADGDLIAEPASWEDGAGRPSPACGRTGEAYTRVVKLTFARGASIPDPSRLFNASVEGNARRAIDIHEGQTVDARAFKALVKAAVTLNRPSTKKR